MQTTRERSGGGTTPPQPCTATAPRRRSVQNLDLIIPEHLRAAHWRGFEMTFALVQGQARGAARGAVAVARDVTERIEQQRADARRDSPG